MITAVVPCYRLLFLKEIYYSNAFNIYYFVGLGDFFSKKTLFPFRKAKGMFPG